ncbi:metallo-beta-lactamase domain-containing protein 1 [Rhagoletis pomonella]|uniref:metallo-beta-lactamase domain-containing protein 1 n=1 Tax=Rhagoletis pomonella TaxID=28610 RepID=UPI0017847D6B|nr:metallo-beta-lactamase domain-containing protein 1 [Rhagoletis pomonella]
MNNGRNGVHVLLIGYSRPDNNDSTAMRANCTCTLIRTRNGRNIIVDTLTAWDGERLTEVLHNLHGLQPKDIHVVVCTHGHSDHTGCNYLFRAAEWHIVGACISNRDKYLDCALTRGESEPFQLCSDDVTVVRTPGHTLSCVSVLVRNTVQGVVGICGDLFERVEDIADPNIWLEAGSENASSQKRQRLRMAELCDYIVPGHGQGFAVTQQMREMLRQQVNASSDHMEDACT